MISATITEYSDSIVINTTDEHGPLQTYELVLDGDHNELANRIASMLQDFDIYATVEE
jgi:hypothetical protein